MAILGFSLLYVEGGKLKSYPWIASSKLGFGVGGIKQKCVHHGKGEDGWVWRKMTNDNDKGGGKKEKSIIDHSAI